MTAVPDVQIPRNLDDLEDYSKLKKMKPHVPGIVIFADHNRQLPWSVTYHAVVMFADISGFTALCETYSHIGQSGVDQLTRTLNDYLSALVEGILGSDGDILKFAGDAILAIWRVGRKFELQNEFLKVAKCCRDIQEKCGEWETDIGVKLSVKIGLAAGEMSITFLGNKEYRHYVELGPAVSAVNDAEKFCKSGMIVISPDTWDYCDPNFFELETLEDGKHMQLLLIIPSKATRSHSLPTHMLFPNTGENISNERPVSPLLAHLSKGVERAQMLSIDESDASVRVSSAVATGSSLKSCVEDKFKIGNRFGKLKKVVTAVTEMKLDIALRLYILSPVLKKLDDSQPLEYLSEMRQVSVVFMNLVLDENREDSAQILQIIFEIVYSKTKSMHGSLNKVFLFDKGCTFLLVFGLPGYKHENDCAHALMCSGRMKSQLDKISGVELVSIGVTTGTSFCGVVGHPKRHEYSVIGRKVNMAARLMMHYPGKITCDADTFHKCRLPESYFLVLATKAMKGLRNVGVIRQFVGFSKDEKTVAKSIGHSDLPFLGREVEQSMFCDQLNAMKENQKHVHLTFSGPSGIGKSRLLDQLLCIAEQTKLRIISCQIELEDSSCPFFLANHIMKSLLSHVDISEDVQKDPFLLNTIGVEQADYIYLLMDLFGVKLEAPDSLIGVAYNETLKKQEMQRKIAEECMLHGYGTVVLIDDAHNIDTSSWRFLCDLQSMKQCLIILGIRPSIIDAPSCREVIEFIEAHSVMLFDLGSLDKTYMTQLTCQVLDVVRIPNDLDRLIRERALGVPLWCMELLRDMMEKKQLFVVQRTRSQTSLPEIIKDVTFTKENTLKPHACRHTEEFGNDNRAISNTSDPYRLLEPEGQQGSRSYGDYKVAILADGVNADDLPVPPAMKEMIIARIDSMRASDQLLVKCASVLGQNVRRDVLEMLLPKAHRPKLAIGIKRLMESGVFECSNTVHAVDEMNDQYTSSKYRCFCQNEDALIQFSDLKVCFRPRFSNKLLQEIAYETLIESQRAELHNRAAVFLELLADDCRRKLPYHWLCASPQRDDLENRLKRIDHKLQDTDAVITMRVRNTESADYIGEDKTWALSRRRGRRLAISFLPGNITRLVKAICEGSASVDDLMKVIDELLPLQDNLIYHWDLAKKKENVLSTYVETISLCLASGKLEKANSLILSALYVYDHSENQQEQFEWKVAELYRLQGMLYLKNDQYDLCRQSLTKAASLLKFHGQTSPSNSSLKMMKIWFKFYLSSKRSCSSLPDQLPLEHGYILSDLYQLDKECGFATSKFAHALTLFLNAKDYSVCIHQVVVAYTAVIECCLEQGKRGRAEQLFSELLQLCADNHEDLNVDDRLMIAQICTRRCKMYLFEGELCKASVAGEAAKLCGNAVSDKRTICELVPFFCFTALFRNEIRATSNILKQLNQMQMTDCTTESPLYWIFCLETALCGGSPPADVDRCLETLRVAVMRDPSAELTLFGINVVSLWFARLGRWSEADVWSSYDRSNRGGDLMFLHAFAEAKRLECQLLMYCHSLACQDVGNLHLLGFLKRGMQRLKSQLGKFPVLIPRWNFLSAYLCGILKQHTKMRKFVGKALGACSKQGHTYEKEWIQYNTSQWQKQEESAEINKVWIQKQLGNSASCINNSPLYCLPLPK
ncbi:adenylate cyclase type 10-like [Mya arenaria]|uniref:adenylate cyclase type 10-like n=1 Tax=Mya arenaria TaxID=6604 RepID=UPI0022DEFE60|nr:adenylate cyclase type 10-like [Mya arenaria]